MSNIAFKSKQAPVAVRISAQDLDQIAAHLNVRDEAAAAQLASAAAALDAAAQRIDEARTAAARDLTETAIALAIEIAEQLLRCEVARGNYDLERIVRDSLASSGVGRGNCTVHLHPHDFATLSEVSFRAGTAIEADPTVAAGDVHISTPQGLLVHETERALESIRAGLQAEFGQ